MSSRTRLAIPAGDVPSGATHEPILHEVQRHHDLSERLAILAGQHPHGSGATREDPVADHHYFG
jgi:hypothetical protein